MQWLLLFPHSSYRTRVAAQQKCPKTKLMSKGKKKKMLQSKAVFIINNNNKKLLAKTQKAKDEFGGF